MPTPPRLARSNLALCTLILAPLALPAAAQDFAFAQSCTLTVSACDMGRDGTDACPAGRSLAAEFGSEGESFSLSVTGGKGTGFGDGERSFALAQGYVSDRLRVFYLLGQDDLDGLFWISVPDGTSGAHLTHGGQEDYLDGTCLPRGQ